MPTKLRPEQPDDDNPIWTKEEFANSVTFDQLPESLRAMLSSRKRGPQKAPTKKLISIRLSQDVVHEFRATGPGWQSRVDSILKDWLKKKAKRTA